MYTWSKELETGNATIDIQHKQWIEALNNLLQACAQGKGRDNIRTTLVFLQGYTAKHFADEELLQKNCEYAEYQVHKKYHDAFKKVVNEIVAEYDKDGPTIALVGKINQNLGGWFVNHIKKEDTKLVNYMHSVSK